MLKKKRTKLRKFLISTLLFLLVLIGSLAILLRSQPVQTWIASTFIEKLSKELKTKISVKSIEFDFFKNIHVEEAYIEDRKGDSMIYLKSFDAELKTYSTDNHYIYFDLGKIHNGFIKIGHYKGTKGKNIDFLVDYFNPPRKGPRKTPKVDWKILFKQANITNTRFEFFDETQIPEQKGIFDPGHLSFSAINGTLDSLWLIDDSLHFTATNLKTIEKCGLHIASFNATCNIHNKGMDFTNMQAKTPCSIIGNELHLSFPGYKYLDEFIDNTNWNGNLKNSHICLNELKIFNTIFTENNSSVDIIKASIGGTIRKFNLQNVLVQYGKNSSITGNYYFDGLPNISKTKCNFTALEINTNAADLSAILANYLFPTQLYNLGNFTYKGNFLGDFYEFSTNGNFTSEAGNAQLQNIAINLKPGLDNATFNGKLITENFDIGKFLNDPSFGIASVNSEFNGVGLNPNTFKLKTNTQINSVIYRNKQYQNAYINGIITKNDFNGEAKINDPNLQLNFNGKFAFNESNPSYQLNTKLVNFNLYDFGITNFPFMITANASIDATGNNANNFQGLIDLSDIQIVTKGKKFSFNSINFNRNISGNKSYLNLISDYGKVNINGIINPNNLVGIFNNILAEIIPSRLTEKKLTVNDSFKYDIDLTKPILLTTIIDPNLEIDKLVANGNVAYYNKNFSLNINQLNCKYKNFYFENFKFNSDKMNENKLNFNCSLEKLFSENKLAFKNIKTSGFMQENKLYCNAILEDKGKENSFQFGLRTNITESDYIVNLVDGNMKLFNQQWDVDRNSYCTISKNKIQCNQLYFESKESFFEATGTFGSNQTDSLTIDFGNVDLDILKPFIPGKNLDSLKATFTGKILITGLFGNPRFYPDNVKATNIAYNRKKYGDLALDITESADKQKLSIGGKFLDTLKGIKLEAFVYYKEINNELFKIKINLDDGIKADLIQPLLTDIVTIKKGMFTGEIIVTGNAEKIHTEGKINAVNSILLVDYLNAQFNFNASFIIDDNGIVSEDEIKLTDDKSGSAYATMGIRHKDFNKWRIDLDIYDAKNLHCLNTTSKDNSLYYGQGYADGSCKINGPFDKLRMLIKVKTKKGTDVSLEYSDKTNNKVAGFVSFEEKKNTSDNIKTKKKVEESSIDRIELFLEASKDAHAQFVIDPVYGDKIAGLGEGNLKMVYDNQNKFYMYGKYTIASGDYTFSLPLVNIINQKILIEKGGSMEWTGDPFNSHVEMIAYRNKTINTNNLMNEYYQNTTNTLKKYPNTDIKSVLKFSGSLFSPQIEFDIDPVSLKNATDPNSTEVLAVINKLRENKDERTKQSIFLLLLGSFVSPNFGGNSSASSGNTNVAFNSAVSPIVNNALKMIFGNIQGQKLNFNLLVDNNQITNSLIPLNNLLLNLNYSFSQNLKLAINGNVDLNGNYSTAAGLDYNIDNHWKLNASYKLRNNQSLVNQSQTGQTVGVGAKYETALRNRKKVKKVKPSAIPTKSNPS